MPFCFLRSEVLRYVYSFFLIYLFIFGLFASLLRLSFLIVFEPFGRCVFLPQLYHQFFSGKNHVLSPSASNIP